MNKNSGTIDTAVILAAGKGTRFGNRTSNMPKGFIPFKGIPMIIRSIENLRNAGIKRIIIGTGYHKEWFERLEAEFPEIKTVYNPEFADTNSMETLACCKDAIGENDFILLESDIIYQPEALTALIDDTAHPDIMLVTPVTKFQDQYYISADRNTGNLTGCSTDREYLINRFKEEPYGELVGIHKISNRFYSSIIEDYFINHKANKKRGYEFEIEDVATKSHLTERAMTDSSDDSGENNYPMFVLNLPDLKWYEIDEESDLEFAEKNIDL